MELQAIHVQSKVHVLQLGGDVSGNTLTVDGGTVHLSGADYTLEQTEYVYPPNVTWDVDLTGYVVSPSEGVATLFVDEVVRDGIDEPYVIDGEEPFEFLDTLFTANIPAGSSLEAGQIRYIEMSYASPDEE
jgi:hypothetical protein